MRGAGTVDPEALIGRKCYVGVDLSLTTDISAAAFFFPATTTGEQHTVKMRYWIPEEQADIDAANGIPYKRWIEEGWITTTDGNIVSLPELADEVVAECTQYQIIRIDIDPWSSKQVQLIFQEASIPCFTLAQQLSVLNAPTQELERMATGGVINHGGDPVLRWMMSNVVLYRDPNNNIRVHKGKSKLKVDGVTALIDAIAGYLTDLAEAPTGSYWDTQDLLAK
jgi:phage terminase large subunit-like protein